MLVTDHFVFLHLHKSGGTFMNRIISHFFLGARLLGYHYPLNKLPQCYHHLPVIGIVRNPWDFYVSWFSFQQQMQKPGALYQIISAQGKNDFNASIEKLLTLSEDEALFKQFRAALPEQLTNHGLNLTRTDLDPIKASGLGFYSFLFRHIFGQEKQIYFMRMENLRDDCLKLMSILNVPISNSFIAALRHTPKQNTSFHQHYSHYYQNDLQQKVSHYDQNLIDQFSYYFK